MTFRKIKVSRVKCNYMALDASIWRRAGGYGQIFEILRSIENANEENCSLFIM